MDQVKNLHTGLCLIFLKVSDQCHSTSQSAHCNLQSEILSCASCTLFSPNILSPRSIATLILSKGIVLVTAISLTSKGPLSDLMAADDIFLKIFFTFSSNILSSIPVLILPKSTISVFIITSCNIVSQGLNYVIKENYSNLFNFFQ